MLTQGCVGDLDRFPTNDLSTDKVYSSFDGYKNVLAKVYGAYALTGNQGPAGSPDVQGLDEGGNADFLRGFWNAQVLTTDEAICAWEDTGIPDLNFINFTSGNPFTRGLYYRCFFQIQMANEFLRESTDDKLSERGIAQRDEVQQMRAEARFLRAFQYWVLMDLFGSPPFVDENSALGKVLPSQISRSDLFAYIKGELEQISGILAGSPDLLAEPRSNEYGRADKAAAWALLARLCLNAEVYTGTAQWDKAAEYAKKVIDVTGYSLMPTYAHLFLADNNLNNPEVILSINYDGERTKSYGGLHFIMNSSFKATRDDNGSIAWKDSLGMGGGWGGNRTRRELYSKFEAADSRAMFVGSKASVDAVSQFEDGMMQIKFKNRTRSGGTGSGGFTDNCADTDFPLFRLAEMYLVYAEAAVKGGGSRTEAVGYINELRTRAGVSPITDNELTLDFILDERARELYWECHRRTDLVRYGRFTDASYTWQWKGGVAQGSGVSSHYNLFPLPASDLMANPNLKQNDRY